MSNKQFEEIEGRVSYVGTSSSNKSVVDSLIKVVDSQGVYTNADFNRWVTITLANRGTSFNLSAGDDVIAIGTDETIFSMTGLLIPVSSEKAVELIDILCGYMRTVDDYAIKVHESSALCRNLGSLLELAGVDHFAVSMFLSSIYASLKEFEERLDVEDKELKDSLLRVRKGVVFSVGSVVLAYMRNADFGVQKAELYLKPVLSITNSLNNELKQCYSDLSSKVEIALEKLSYIQECLEEVC